MENREKMLLAEIVANINYEVFERIARSVNEYLCKVSINKIGIDQINAEDLKGLLVKGLAFDDLADSKGFGSVLGFKTSYKKRNELLANELDLYKKAYEIALDELSDKALCDECYGCKHQLDNLECGLTNSIHDCRREDWERYISKKAREEVENDR